MDGIPETLKAGFQQVRAEASLNAVQVFKAYARYHPRLATKCCYRSLWPMALGGIKPCQTGLSAPVRPRNLPLP